MPDDVPALDTIPGPAPREIAPPWHTAVLILLLLFFSGLSAYSHTLSPITSQHGMLLGYLSVIVMQWVVLAFVWYGLRLRGVSLRDVIGSEWPKWTSIVRDLGIAVAFLIVAGITLAAVGHVLHASNREVARRVLPHTRAPKSRPTSCSAQPPDSARK